MSKHHFFIRKVLSREIKAIKPFFRPKIIFSNEKPFGKAACKMHALETKKAKIPFGTKVA